MAGKTTIRDLARAGGVSVGTVSRALNGYTDVSDETRAKILRLAAEMDYTPAAAARALVTRRSHVVGVFLETGEGHPDLQHPFFHGVLVGLKDALGSAGYDLLLFASETPGNGYGAHSYLMRARHHNVDAAVLLGSMSDEDPEVRRLIRSGVPCIGVDMDLPGPSSACVTSENAVGMRLAVEHLAKLGHTRIATICGMLETLPGRERLRGYRDGLKQVGLTLRDEYVGHGDFYFESGHREAAALLQLPEPPTAIVAASDMMAVGALRAAEAAGVTVPGDLSVIGFDDMLLAEHLTPALTTLRQDKAGIGAAAAAALHRLIETGEPPQTTIELPVELVVRDSTGARR